MSEETKDQQASEPEADGQSDVSPQTEGEAQVQEAEQAEEVEDTLPKFTFATEDTGSLKKKVTVTVPRERIDAKLDEMFGDLGRTAPVPGFRIGRAPRRLVEKRFGREVSQDVRNAMVGESLEQVLQDIDFRPIGEPDLDLEKIELPDNGVMEFSFEIEAAPEFELPELEGIPLQKHVFEVTDERGNEQIDRFRERAASFENSDGPAAAGDVIEAATRVTGEDIGDPVESKGLTLHVAPGQIEGLPLVDLGKELTGKNVGDTVSMTVDIPKAHPNEAWQGKQATVEITIKAMRHRTLPELDDEFAARAGFDSMQEMRSLMESALKRNAEQEVRRGMHEQICGYLLDKVQFDLPEGLAARHAERVLQRRYLDLLERGFSQEKIAEHLTELKAAADEQSVADLKLQFITGKIADEQDIDITEEEVNSRIASIAASQQRRPERLRQELEQGGALTQVQIMLVEEKVMDALLKKAKITEVAQEEPASDEQTETSDAETPQDSKEE